MQIATWVVHRGKQTVSSSSRRHLKHSQLAVDNYRLIWVFWFGSQAIFYYYFFLIRRHVAQDSYMCVLFWSFMNYSTAPAQIKS